MGNLTVYLQNAFAEYCPAGWTSRSEVRLLREEFNELFGYSSRADVLLAKADGSRRLWIEFEISRADPVANNAKFAAAHLFSRQLESDCFVSMVSSHVQRGRRNLAANTIHVMREAGMRAFQTVLLPEFGPETIKQINHARLGDIQDYSLQIRREIKRAVSISESVAGVKEKRIHYASNLLEVMMNLRRWNYELLTEQGRELWGKRTITYFAFDRLTQSFAPSKFCAYVPVGRSFDYADGRAIVEMTLSLYSTLEAEPSFDGNRAQTHLTKYLAMNRINPDDRTDISFLFDKWLSKYSDHINVSPKGPVFLVPNEWLI